MPHNRGQIVADGGVQLPSLTSQSAIGTDSSGNIVSGTAASGNPLTSSVQALSSNFTTSAATNYEAIDSLTINNGIVLTITNQTVLQIS